MIWIVGLEDSEKNLNFSKLLSGESGEEKCVKRKKKESRYIFIWVSLKLMSFWYRIPELFVELIWIKLSFKKNLEERQ